MGWVRGRGLEKEVFLSFTQWGSGVGVGVLVGAVVGVGVLVGFVPPPPPPPPPLVGSLQPQEI